MRYGFTLWVAFALAPGFASSAANADTPGGSAASFGLTTAAPNIDAQGMFLIILILAISFAWIRTLPIIDRIEAWLLRE